MRLGSDRHQGMPMVLIGLSVCVKPYLLVICSGGVFWNCAAKVQDLANGGRSAVFRNSSVGMRSTELPAAFMKKSSRRRN